MTTSTPKVVFSSEFMVCPASLCLEPMNHHTTSHNRSPLVRARSLPLFLPPSGFPARPVAPLPPSLPYRLSHRHVLNPCRRRPLHILNPGRGRDRHRHVLDLRSGPWRHCYVLHLCLGHGRVELLRGVLDCSLFIPVCDAIESHLVGIIALVCTFDPQVIFDQVTHVTRAQGAFG